MILSDDELVQLTRKMRRKAQIKVLVKLGVPYRQRPDLSIVVFRRDLDAPTEERSPSPRLRLPPARGDLVREGREMDPAGPGLRLAAGAR